jgi:hypothetical protein
MEFRLLGRFSFRISLAWPFLSRCVVVDGGYGDDVGEMGVHARVSLVVAVMERSGSGWLACWIGFTLVVMKFNMATHPLVLCI